MKSGMLLRKIFAGFLFATMVVSSQNCGVQKPRVENASFMSTSFSHTGTETSCVACHGAQRPSSNETLPVVASVAINKAPSRFAHAQLYKGLNDCAACHTSKMTNIGLSFKNAHYDHADNSGNTINTCRTCHEPPLAKPSTTPAIAFDHSGIGAQDCASCHHKPGTTWADGSGAHSHLVTDQCTNCHIGIRPDANTWKPDRIVGSAYKNLFAHTVDQVGTQTSFAAGAADRCTECHTKTVANLGVSWKGGGYNHKNYDGSNVTTCLGCHSIGDDRPSDTVSVPSGPINNVYVHNGTNNGLSDCKSCHTANIGSSWSSGAFDHKNSTGTQVTTCLSCHAASPSGVAISATTAYPGPTSSNGVKSAFIHDANYVGTGECVGCHTPKLTNLKTSAAWSGARWKSSVFGDHKLANGTTVSTCLSCHQLSGHNTGQECANCHMGQRTTATPGVRWTN